MIQFYFLSVLLNILIGIILLTSNNSTKIENFEDDFQSENEENKKSKKQKFNFSLESDSVLSNETFCLVASIICAFIGFIKLFFVYSKTGKNIFIIGDFFPAFFGILGGVTIALEFYSKSFADHELPDFFETFLFSNKKYLGFICIIFGILHFAFPGVLFF